MSTPTAGGLPIEVDVNAAAPATDDDTAAALLAGLIETVRVMRDNAYARALTTAFRQYDEAHALLILAAEHLRPIEADAYSNPLDKVADAARREATR